MKDKTEPGSLDEVEMELRQYSFEHDLREQLAALRNTQQPAVIQKLGAELEQLGQWLTDRYNELIRLLEISTELNKGVLLDDILVRIYTFFKEIIPYERIGCALIDDDYKNVTAYWAKFTYDTEPQITKGYSAPLAGSSLQTIIDTGQPRIINDLEEYLKKHPGSESTQRIVAEGIRSSLTCPLLADGRAVGFLFFSSTKKNTYKGLHQEVFIYIAAQVAHLIEKSKLYEKIVGLNQRLLAANQQLREQASRDALTGVFNHGAIIEFAQQKLNRAARIPFGIVMLDIDYFKQVNDTYGHIQGDLVLRKVAATIADEVKPSDRLGRYGGEEFLLLLNDVSEAQMLAVAERIRAAVEQIEVPTEQDPIRVTISVGATHVEPDAAVSLTEVLQCADEALYRAKNNGRNQVQQGHLPEVTGAGAEQV